MIRRFSILFAIAAAAACDTLRGPQLPPVQYQAPAVGTVYRYRGFSHRVLESDGLRVLIQDDSGRKANILGRFIMDDPAQPSRYDTAALARLWPLREGNTTSVVVRNGEYAWKWQFNVRAQERVTIPGAGSFDAYVVQAVQSPEPLRDSSQTVVGYTWMFAPKANAVVRFATTYLTGPARGRRVSSDLQAIEGGQPADK